MSFTRWLRSNSEHYLLLDAHARLSDEYGLPRPPVGSRTPSRLFWSRVFVPVYRALPWPMRRRVMQLLPGSHRKKWSAAPKRHDPAI